MAERTDERREGEVRPGDGGRHLADAVRQIDLAQEARALREDETWRREGHNASTLVKNERLRVVLVDMHAAARMGEHRTGSRVSIQVLTGRVRVVIPGRVLEVPAGQLVALDASMPHDVEAVEQSSFLLTIALEDDAPGASSH